MVHVLFLPIWVLSISPCLAILRAGPGPVVPSISRRLLSSERELISQFSADTEAESPGAKHFPVSSSHGLKFV